MGFEKIRKSASNLTSLMIIILLVIGFFIGMFNYMDYQSTRSGITISENYTIAKDNLDSARVDLKENIDDIKGNLSLAVEPDQGIFAVINGFRGLGKVLQLPITLISVGIETYNAMGITIQGVNIPSWLLTLVLIGITGFIVFLIVSIMKGDQQKI